MQTSTLMLVEVAETLRGTSRRSSDLKDFSWVIDSIPNTPTTHAYLTSLSKHYLIIPIYSKTLQLQSARSIHSVHTHTHSSYADTLNIKYCGYIPVTTTVTNTAIIFKELGMLTLTVKQNYICYYIIGVYNNDMFRPYMWAIIRLWLDL